MKHDKGGAHRLLQVITFPKKLNIASYALRERKEVDYQNKLPLPRARRNKQARIYPIEVV